MDAFYASVEQRRPGLRGCRWWSPAGARSVVAHHRRPKFGVRSRASDREHFAGRDFVPPDSAVIAPPRAMCVRFSATHRPGQPLSLDEAYLDVTENKLGLASATAVALAIRQSIREETGLTASAGLAPNKFLARSPRLARRTANCHPTRAVEAFLTRWWPSCMAWAG
jgi:DNA polymerase-4